MWLKWTAPAIRDLTSAGEFIAADNPVAATKMAARILEAVEVAVHHVHIHLDPAADHADRVEHAFLAVDQEMLADHVHGWLHLVRGTERFTLPVPSPAPTVRETLNAFVRALREGTAFPISSAVRESSPNAVSGCCTPRSAVWNPRTQDTRSSR